MGRYLFGVTALLMGVASLVLNDQLISNWQLPGGQAFIVGTSIAQILGGAALLLPRTAAPGAIILGTVYLIFSLTFVPDVIAQPLVYASWGNLFYQLALVAGAAVVLRWSMRYAVILFGLCNISYAIEQVEFLARSVSLVPSWIPPNGMFWAIATSVAFGLGGLSLVIGYASLLAARLLALMLIGFGVLIWIPILIADHKTHSNWSEGIETFAIGAVAWIIAEYFAQRSRGSRASSGV